MKKTSFLLIACLTAVAMLSMSSCTSGSKNKEQQETQAQTDASSLSIDELLSDAEILIGTTVTIEGVCTHICSHGARKIFLMGTDDTKTIRIEATDNTGAFSQDCVNSMVSVTGKVVEERIDEAYLVSWEAREKEGTTETHGEDEEAGCASEQQAQNEDPVDTFEERIANFRKRIAEEKERTGKAYLAFYHVTADSYTIN